MKNFLFSILALLLIFPVNVAFADVWVNGYTRSDGTSVQGHYRSSPDGNPYNNWSFPGNTNPYTGETAGGSVDSYLRNNSGSSYTPSYNIDYGSSDTPSYSNSYNSSYSSSYSGIDFDDLYEEVDNGRIAYGILSCDIGYYKKGNNCVKEPSNGRVVGSTLFCDSGYKESDGQCVQPRNGSYNYFGSVTCDSGYRNVDGRCKKDTLELRCEISFGDNVKPALGSDDSCICSSGYQWSAGGSSCELIPEKETRTIKGYVKSVGDSNSISCNEMQWVNYEDTASCVFYKANKSKYNWSIR